MSGQNPGPSCAFGGRRYFVESTKTTILPALNVWRVHVTDPIILELMPMVPSAEVKRAITPRFRPGPRRA